MGILWAHTGAIGCIWLRELVVHQVFCAYMERAIFKVNSRWNLIKAELVSYTFILKKLGHVYLQEGIGKY